MRFNMNKKGVGMTSVFITLIIVMGLFYGMFGYVTDNYSSAGLTEETGYEQSLTDIQTVQSNMTADIEAIKTSGQGIVEADANVFLVAWNGLTGLAGTIRLMFGTVDLAVAIWHALLPGLDFFPDWVILLIELALTIGIVLIIIGLFKGEAKT